MKNSDGVWFGVAVDGRAIAASGFSDSHERVVQKIRESLPKNAHVPLNSVPSSFAKNALAVMKDVYDGKTPTETVALSMERLPKYTQRVLTTVSQIPVGYVASYGAVAEATGGGARAVGNVMASNPFAPLVPCHRVVTSSLGLGGYGGGLRVKFEFLKREKQGFTDPTEVLVDGGGLRVFPVEFVLKKLDKAASWKKL
ncbi:MAG: methylated-DNA--[protein]-cysteine S-methyltransferase [Candidatus Bathyarchaeota archaeon]|nr:methylated-DNA--[protein]-cysteine S-methyltransferase [Candidatus Bathyarchaeota archaeon]